MKMFPRILSIVALAALALTATQCRRARQGPSTALEDGTQSPVAKAPANPPAAGKPKAADLPGFALIPGGEFTMGDALDGNENAPQHKVNVSAFHMQKTEVTKAEWEEVRAWGLEHGYTDLPEGDGKAADHPVQKVMWHDAVKWCNARSEMEGLKPCCSVRGKIYLTGVSDSVVCDWKANGYRLPTEAEWEKAARGGLSGKRFPWGDTISHNEANFCNDGEEVYQNGTTGIHPTYKTDAMPYTSPVGSFAANGYGLYDMAGNLWEWCWDWDGTYPSTSQTDPRGATSGPYRLGRGGDWNNGAYGCCVAYRGSSIPSGSNDTIGFRIARSSVPSNSR